jgi:hypothetical protein
VCSSPTRRVEHWQRFAWSGSVRRSRGCHSRSPPLRRPRAIALQNSNPVNQIRRPRERLKEELRAALQARSVILRDEPSPLLAPNTLCFDVPFGYGEGRAARDSVRHAAPARQLELSDHRRRHPARRHDPRARAGDRPPVVGAARRQGDWAAPLIGSSEAIRRVRERIERVAATDFTILIEGNRVHNRTPVLLGFRVELPSVEARGQWRERGRMGRKG